MIEIQLLKRSDWESRQVNYVPDAVPPRCPMSNKTQCQWD